MAVSDGVGGQNVVGGVGEGDGGLQGEGFMGKQSIHNGGRSAA
jgi:hypothetical protein